MTAKSNGCPQPLLRFAAALVLLAACSSVASGHQTPVVSIPPGEIGNAPPPLPGSAKFFRSALPLLRPRCDAESAETLDKIERLVRDANAVRWGAVAGVDPRAAENLRAQAESELIRLLGALPAPLVIDLAEPDSSIAAVGLDPQHGSILIRVVDGEGLGDVRFVEWDVASEDFDRDTQLIVTGGGVTHFLVRLAGAPQEPFTVRFAVRREAEPTPAAAKPIRFSTPPTGRLILSLRDERARPTHALVAIRPPGGGAHREPPGAVNLRGQLNSVVSQTWVDEPGWGYLFQLPGAKRGRYWITPPETDMNLPAGEWEVRVLRGPEHTPVVDRFVVEADRVTRAEYSVRRWTHQPSRGWWSGDDHVHARLMSGADAGRLLAYAEAVDLHVANILEMGDPLRTYYPQRGFGRDYRVNRGDRWLVPGQEDPRSDLGHAIGLNLRRRVRDLDRYLQNDLLAEEIHRGGGLYGHTHLSDGACFAHREMALFTPQTTVDFTSIMQSSLGVGLYYDFLNLGFKLAASAGADTPYAGTMGAVRVYAHTGGDALPEPEEWFDALRAGRTFVTNGPMLELTVAGVGPGGSVKASAGSELRVVATARGDAGWSSPKRIAIVRLGEEVAASTSDDPTGAELSVEATAPAGAGCWIAATATGHDGSQAHTTPVYVTTDGVWHGDSARAAAIAERQLKVLHEIEEEVLRESERLIAEGRRHPMNLQPLTNAGQAEAVRERIEIAGRFYRGLIERFRDTD